MKTAVFLIQNQTTFVCPCAQPNSHPKNCPALHRRLARRPEHLRQRQHRRRRRERDPRPPHRPQPRPDGSFAPRLAAPSLFEHSTAAPCASAMHAPINIITTKLCACTSGSKPRHDARRDHLPRRRKAEGRRRNCCRRAASSSSNAPTAFAAASQRLPSPAFPLAFFFPTPTALNLRRRASSPLPSLPSAFCLLPSQRVPPQRPHDERERRRRAGCCAA